MRYRLIFTLITLTIIFGCNDEQPQPQDLEDASGILVINEGTFQWGNASLGLFEPSSGRYTDMVYEKANKLPIGDVFFSVTLVDDEYWCVVNNSGVIRILDTSSFVQTAEVKGLTSPRYICEGYNGQVYVSDLYADGIYVVDKASRSIDTFIYLDGWTEYMLMAGERLFVTNQERPFLFLVNPYTQKVVDSLEIGDLPNSMLRADNATILVLCEGRLGSSDPSTMYLIDPKARQVTSRYDFSADGNPSMLRKSSGDNTIYYVDDGIYSLNSPGYVPGKKVASFDFIPYGFDIGPAGEFYVSDALNFVDPSIVHRYTKDGKEIGQFNAGVNTNGFFFR